MEFLNFVRERSAELQMMPAHDRERTKRLILADDRLTDMIKKIMVLLLDHPEILAA